MGGDLGELAGDYVGGKLGCGEALGTAGEQIGTELGEGIGGYISDHL